jgi:hypothetical protein
MLFKKTIIPTSYFILLKTKNIFLFKCLIYSYLHKYYLLSKVCITNKQHNYKTTYICSQKKHILKTFKSMNQ